MELVMSTETTGGFQDFKNVCVYVRPGGNKQGQDYLIQDCYTLYSL